MQYRHLYFNEVQQTLARYPNYNPSNPFEGGYLLSALDGPERDTGIYLPIVRPGWGNVPSGEDYPEIVLFDPDDQDWETNVLTITTIDTARANWAVFGQPCETNITGGRRFYVRNVLQELDTAGEWFLSHATNTLYFYPPSGGAPANGSVVLGYLRRLLVLDMHRTSTLSA